MARDRQRAKQRRDRARRTSPGGPGARPGSPREPRAGGDDVLPRAGVDETAFPLEEESPPRGAERGGRSRAEADSTLDAPEPLEHASAEVDIANAQVALGRAEAGDDEPFSPEEEAAWEREEPAVATRERELSPVPAEPAGAAPARAEAEGNRALAFIRASWRELQRVQWPDRRQVAQATGVVLVFVLVAGLYLGLCDEVFNRLVDALL